ncbi:MULTISPECIES: hypothetical protein [unclassified Novosphingobium]|jgi:hypothetical protein|uniref:hypothetical protein n=1 Tax=unclassified Novosphingobium TaxID=2644732 RepID=UPI00061CB1AB|nr:hypothetical protein [Novosphingobium sp. MD-1]GAO54700.1 hypothetical protein NMD1_01802 [Novosphingobium sp. MD-1]
MRLVVTALIFLTGLFDLFMAVSFLLDPGSAGAGLGVAAIGMAGGPQGAAAGLSTIRADFTSFFGVGAFCMMWGAWRRNADLLLVPALLFGVSFVGRAVNVAMVGPYPQWPLPMGVEAFHVALALAAWRLLPHHRISDIAA